jgi:single-strand DNA-binding protein
MSTQVTLRGNLTRDPEVRYSAAGKPVVNFTVITSRRFKNPQTDQWEDKDVTFWNCVAFGQLAENAAESLERGTGVIVQGNAAQEEWEKDGEKRRAMKVTVDDVAVSLRFRSAKVAKAAERSKDPERQDSPFRDEAPF